MCGIAGIVSKAHDVYAEQTVGEMLAAQAHRGPEGSEVARLDEAVFGCCRLAFVDIGISQQPYRSPDRRTLITFNGEIYNHRELRQSLSAGGSPLTTPGETAILTELYARYGLDMVHRLNGMFAIAIFDAQRGETVLIRDHFGKKPLYYFVCGHQVVFASELQALQMHSETPTDLDPQSVALYLMFNAVPSPACIVQGVQKVPAGSIVRIRDGVVRTEQYWQPRLAALERPRQELLAQFHERLLQAVQRRLPDVPFGIFLSGGLDSSVVAALAARCSGLALRTFSVGFPDQSSYDESQHARAVAALLGASHTVVPLTLEDLADQAVRCLTSIDEPVADQSLVATNLLAQVARQEVKAVITGDGADELLMGYRLFQAAVVLRALTGVLPPHTLQRALAHLGAGRPSDQNLHYTHVAKLLARTLTEPPERQYYAAAAAVLPADWDALFQPEITRQIRPLDPFAQLDRFTSAQGAAPVERLQLGMICHFLRDTILTKLDRATMLASVEARSPFLDRDLVELFLRLPRHWKLRGLTTKYILKQVALQYLPRHLVYRQKRGFRAPTAALLRGPLREFLCDMLAPDAIQRAGMFQPARIQTLLAEHFNHTHDHHRVLWALLCLESWRQTRRPAAPEQITRMMEREL